MQLHMQAVMWRQVLAKPRGGETTSKPKDTLANKKPEEKQKWFSHNNSGPALGGNEYWNWKW